ncbi:cytochrome P450 [Aspergillus cavernicola]|uniref:Cytochrome P450 n=1 Tax=Aspergillus cavernicola TaxID=176166 RepID=A0ABR4I6B0_9EURO
MSSQYFLLVLVLLLLYISCLSIYRVFFHPLSKYPGPTLSALTNWHAAFHTYHGKLHIHTHTLHKRYGDVVRAGPNTLWFNTPSALHEIYGTRANVRKSDPWMALSASRRSPNILSVIDKSVSSFKRRTLAPVFNDNGLKHFEDRIIGHVKRFTALLDPGSASTEPTVPRGGEEKAENGNTWGPVVDVADVSNWFAFDAISSISYGRSFRMLESPEMRWLPTVYTVMSRRSMISLVQPKVIQWKIDRIFLAAWYRQILAGGSWIFNRAKARKAEAEAKATEAEAAQVEVDIFSFLMKAKDPKKGLQYTLKDMWIESMLLLAAGADTTAATIAFAFFYLLHNPTSLQHLTTELRTTFTTAEEIRPGPKLSSCAFLHACITETMRLAPAVPNGSPRTVLDPGLTVNGEPLPPGTTVSTSLFALHRNESYFPVAEEFIPERWMSGPESGRGGVSTDESDSSSCDSSNNRSKAFYPFGLGPRSCIGARLAWLELTLLLARTLYLFDVMGAGKEGSLRCCESGDRPAASSQRCDYGMRSYALFAPRGPVVRFRRRPV